MCPHPSDPLINLRERERESLEGKRGNEMWMGEIRNLEVVGRNQNKSYLIN